VDFQPTFNTPEATLITPPTTPKEESNPKSEIEDEEEFETINLKRTLSPRRIATRLQSSFKLEAHKTEHIPIEHILAGKIDTLENWTVEVQAIDDSDPEKKFDSNRGWTRDL
jgi:hypothetical protein